MAARKSESERKSSDQYAASSFPSVTGTSPEEIPG